ncbi:MAG: class I SAM-dependent methyltransferase [Acidocella sp.]|nr:class I SAM-dependent methyltransferase [Acidocella sp.]
MLFFDNVETMDYSSSELIEIGWHIYQTQIGAGIWPITEPLTRIAKPPGARLLEIGGAYGFGQDFGVRARGWVGEGYDPSPLAQFGISELGLNITQGYFEDKDLAKGPYDVVIATEVVEHLAHPPEFLHLMQRALGDSGILMLTTPNGALLAPSQGANILLQTLSPGAHLVLQTANSLKIALQNAGFSHVEICETDMALIAYASNSPFVLSQDVAAGRAIYRRYLVERGRLAEPESDLRFGFAGRGMFEALQDGDFDAAEAAWSVLVPAAKQRFALDLNSMVALPAAATRASIANLARVIPLGLGMILYSRAIYLLFRSHQRAAVLPIFQMSLAALDALQEAMAQRSLTDGLTESLRRTTKAEILLCLAEAAHPDILSVAQRLLHEDPSSITTIWRAFVSLVSTGAFVLARDLQKALELYLPDESFAFELRRDALFSLGVLALQDEKYHPRAAESFRQVRTVFLNNQADPGNLFWSTVRGEVIALDNLNRRDLATSLLSELIPQNPNPPADLLERHRLKS